MNTVVTREEALLIHRLIDDVQKVSHVEIHLARRRTDMNVVWELHRSHNTHIAPSPDAKVHITTAYVYCSQYLECLAGIRVTTEMVSPINTASSPPAPHDRKANNTTASSSCSQVYSD